MDRGKMLRRARRLLLDAALILAVYAGVSVWQTRDLLPAGKGLPAPVFDLPDLEGAVHRLGAGGRPTLVYFFAPWCSVCELTSGNVQELKEALGDDLRVLAVGLSYKDKAAVQRFAGEHELTVPVLLGHEQVSAAYQISAFPTFYYLDSAGRIVNHLVGYTSRPGLQLRQ